MIKSTSMTSTIGVTLISLFISSWLPAFMPMEIVLGSGSDARAAGQVYDRRLRPARSAGIVPGRLNAGNAA
jgi:hypothetical protein